MFRKLNLKIILPIFLVLLIILVIVKYIDTKKGERTFKDNLVTVDPDQVTEVQIFPRPMKGKSFNITKNGDSWILESDGKKYNADPSIVNSMISELNRLKPLSVVATKKERWGQYEVTDSLGTRVKLFDKEQLLADVVVGKFNINQPQDMTSYVRLVNDNNVYDVNGYASMTFTQPLNAYRDQKVIKDDTKNWTKLTFTYPSDSSFVLSRIDNQWMINGASADSAAVVKYLSTIGRLSNDKFAEADSAGSPNHTLKIEGDNLAAPIQVNGYLKKGSYMVESSQNPGTYFNSTSLADKIFISRNKLLKQ